jgi:hypothetical protein
LLVGIKTNKEYNKATKDQSEDKDESESDEASSELTDEMEGQIADRVDILKEQGVTNIETVFPRVHLDENVEEKSRELAGITSEMTRLMMAPDFNQTEFNKLRDKAQELTGQQKSEELNEIELKAFFEARRKLAEQEGYEVDGGDDSGWFTIRKNGIEFQMKNFAFPSDSGIGGYSRISKMGVSRKSGQKSESLLYYDRGWDIANEDPEAQKEIDRVIALFG